MSALPVSIGAPAPESDFRSVRLQHDFEREWKRVKRQTKSLQTRLDWLNREWAIANCAAHRREELIKSIDDQRAQLRDQLFRTAPSVRWIEDGANGVEFPPGGRKTGMVLSRQTTRIGDNTVGTRRFTPPQCVSEEDMIDKLSAHEAIWGDGEIFPLKWPASISALAIIRIGHLRSREASERELRRRG